MLFAQDHQAVRAHQLFKPGRRLRNGHDWPNSLLDGLFLSGEQGLGSALLEQETTPDGLFCLDETTDGLPGIRQDVVGRRVAVIRQTAQETKRAEVISLRLGLNCLMGPIGKFEDTPHPFTSQ